MIKDFKEFIARGNVMDLAVGVIIGGAFGKIVSSLVDNVIMPLIGLLIGGLDFSNLSINMGEASINYGLFIGAVVDFLIIAASIFLVIRQINRFKAKEEAVVEEEPTSKECPYCISQIPIEATRCPNCTSQLGE